MNYRYKDFEFATDLEFYRIVAADISSPYIKETRGICYIYYPKDLGAIPQITTQFQQIYFTYNSVKLRLKSVNPVTLVVIDIKDLGDTLVNSSDTFVHILSNDLNEELITSSLIDSGLFEYVSGSPSEEFKYKELINFAVNTTIDLNKYYLPTRPILLEDTKDRYILDMTHSMYALYDRFSIELKKQGFYLKNLNETEETKTREVATLSFQEYQKDLFRLYPNWNLESTTYRVPVRLTLNTTSVSKFERLLSEINAHKFLKNIVRVYLEDSLKRIWCTNIKWDNEINTNTPDKAENEKGESSYFIELSFEYEFFVVRNNTYKSIRQILLNIRNHEPTES